MVSSLESFALRTEGKKLRVAIIGCGSVSGSYIPKLQTSDIIEIVSLCGDIKYERALERKKRLNVSAERW